MRLLGAELPGPTAIARRAGPRLVEATVIPLALFYVAMWAAGVWAGIGCALVWQYAALGRRVVRATSVPGVLVFGAAGLTARTAITAATGSAFVYFVQPAVMTAAIGVVFMLSVPLGRPLGGKLVRDFVPLPDDLVARPSVQRYFRSMSVFWGVVNLLNAALVTGLLLTERLTTYLVVSRVASLALTSTAVTVSAIWFVVVARRDAAARPESPSKADAGARRPARGRGDRVAEQHGARHRADAAHAWRDPAGGLGHSLVHV